MLDQCRRRFCALAGASLIGISSGVDAQSAADARTIIGKVESLLWANTLRADFDMHIVSPRWERTLRINVWMERPRRSFIRIIAPAKEAGIGSLRIGDEMWNYLPAVERTIKIPPSMMLQAWMGSDFANDDLVKQSSELNDYNHRLLDDGVVEGQPVWRIEATPKPDAVVVWGQIIYWIRKDHIPVRQEFYNERRELIRALTFSEIKLIGHRQVPSRWEMRSAAKPDHYTVITVRDAYYNPRIDDDVFTHRNLQRK